MFLSTENPPNDPLSSSSNLLHLTSSSHELGQSHLSNFSIRDYVYSNRKKNIKNNWPFSSKSLQLFLAHGVTDPLPPFQKLPQSSSSKNQIVSYVHRETTSSAKLAETRKEVCSSQSKIIENGQVSKSQVIANNKNSHSKKTRKGMVKSKEDSLVTTASESIMASKTCPICKTFSSASNTTLNAHIDQCLSVDSTLPPVCRKPNKPQCLSVEPPVCSKPNKPKIVKPRLKVKTMVDIYATAKEGTLEDLDRRNGTKWASVLSYTNRVVTDNNKPQVSTKKRKDSPVGVGPVYIDDKGQKLRILSEFSEKKKTCTTTPLREQQEEDGTSEKICLSHGNNKFTRKRRKGKKPHKFLKLTNHKANASEIPEHERGFCGEGSNKGHRRIFNQRMLAKRGLISKKINEKGRKFYASSENDDDDDDDSWSGGDPIVLRDEVCRRSKAFSVSKRAQSRSFRVRMSEKEEESLERVHLSTVQLKKSLAEVSDASPRGTSKRKLSPPLVVANGWRRLSMPVELKKARLDDYSEKEDDDEEEETGKWESEMTQERELSNYDDYVSDDNGETNEVSNPTSSGYGHYDDDDEERSEEEDNNNSKGGKTDDMGAEFYQSDTTPSIETEQAMYYSEEVGNMVYDQTPCEEDVRFDSQVRQGSLFVEVDTIPIPGPPGSFLPSPRDMGFDENLGNSSVITSQVDRNSSESPVSAVSNFAAGRLSFPSELSSFRESFSSTATPMSFSVPSEPITVDNTTPSRLRSNDHESCCCQRREMISGGLTLNHQASHLLQRRAASINLTKSPTCGDPNHPFEQSQQDLDLQIKLFNRTNLNNTVPPSPSNPVLRLMGKDLMIMNQGEAENKEASRSSLTPRPQFLDPPPCTGTGSYFNTGLYLRNSFESTHQPQSPPNAQASTVRNNFDHTRYFSPR